MSSPPNPSARVTQQAIVVGLALCWAACAWPALRDSITTAPGRVGLGAFALGGAIGLALPQLSRRLAGLIARGSDRAWLATLALLGAAITAWLWFGPMNAQVISSDGCVYLLQGRAASHGSLGVPIHAPRIAFAAKFLVEGADRQLHSVFVPGYPVFLAPFVALGVPWLSGLVVGAALSLAQHHLAKHLSDDGFTPRLSLLLLLPSFARGIETADLMSHAFVGALDLAALTLALRCRREARGSELAMLGACVGWVFSSRMLDGFVLAAVCAAALIGPIVRRRIGVRGIAVALLCFAPFVALVGAQQKACTGSWRRACVLEYVARGDHPPTCLRLGFGRDVGCAVEHARERAAFGDDGYTPDDALRLVRERTSRLSVEALGVALLAVLALLGAARAVRFELLLVASFPVLLTLAYALFYYGNSVVHGARHVFPAAPLLTILAARAFASTPAPLRARIDDARWRGAALIAWITTIPLAHGPQWLVGLAEVSSIQRGRIPLARRVRDAGITRGVFVVPDLHSYLADLDPWRDGVERVFVHDDRAGVVDVRRFFPSLPVHLLSPEGRFLRVGSAPPGPGLDLEFERAWPTFQRPTGCGAMILHTQDCCRVATRGGRALFVFAATQGARLEVPFDLAQSGRYELRLEGYQGVDHGRWEISIDGRALGRWEGYAPSVTPLTLRAPEAQTLAAGAHRFEARCVGKHPSSTDHHALFDALRASPAR